MAVRNKKTSLRIGDSLRNWVQEQAEKNGRSMNSEILQILRREKERLLSKQAA